MEDRATTISAYPKTTETEVNTEAANGFRPASHSRSAPQNRWFGGPISLAFGGTFLVVASVLFWMLGAKPILHWLESLRWVEVACKIDSAEVVVDHKTKALNYLPEVRYRYQWNDQTYNGTRFAWDAASYSKRASIEKWIEPFPAGKETVCYVNPQKPEESVLLRSFPKPTVFVAMVTFFFMALGVEIVGTILCGLLPPWSVSSPQRPSSDPEFKKLTNG